MSAFTGTVDFTIAGQTGTLFYGYAQITQAMERFGDDVFSRLSSMKPLELVELAAIGFARHSPEITKDKILEAQPPIITLIQAVDRAFAISFFGPELAEKLTAKSTEEKKS